MAVERLEQRRVLSTSPFNLDDFPTLPSTVAVGEGSITTVLPAGEARPSLSPNLTADFDGPSPASEWWSSIAFGPTGPTFPVHSHPLATVDHANGLAIGYPSTASASGNSFSYPFVEDVRIGLSGFAPGRPAVADHTDWTVTTRWESGGDRLETTFGHGLPFVYATRTGTRDAVIDLAPGATVWSNSAGVAGFTVGGRHYGVFAPTDATWSLSGGNLTSDLNGGDYFSVAVLPDASQATLDFFRARAFAFVTDSRVDWSYDATTAVVSATYSLTTAPQETGGVNIDEPLTALYRHQWLYSDDPVTSHRYESSRGDMRLLAGHAFTTEMTHTGVLPVLPTIGADPVVTRAYIDEVLGAGDLIATTDTYFTGTNLYKIARLIPLAEQIGYIEARDRFLAEVRDELEDWFDADDDGQGRFYFDQEWNSLIGYPDSFGSATSLNDHHFHYGYFIQSAAIVAMYDPDWASESEWGGMVELLIRDSANWERDDATFQFLRSFDIYAGHSWASGDAEFGRGNNQESSSEAMNFSNGLIMWGSVTGDDEIRDLGLFLSATHQATIEQYWFDVDEEVFPAAYRHPAAGIVWSDGADYSTFFSGEPELIQGINYLPLAGGSLYLGRDPAYVQSAYDHIVQENGGPPNDWQDVMASYLALADPDAALADFLANPTDSIQPRALTYQWITALEGLGLFDPTVTADTPHHAVFSDGGQRTYVAYNPGSQTVQVSFSDGTTVQAPAGALVASGAQTFLWAPDPDLQPATPENRLFLRDQQAAAPTATLAFAAGRDADTDTLPTPVGGVFFDQPNNPVVYVADGLNGLYDGSLSTGLQVYLDAGGNAGAMTQARVSYDFQGDGVADRIELFAGFPSDGVVGWEAYTETQGIVLTSGAFQDFADGTVTLEVWSVFGPGGVDVRTEAGFGEGLQSHLDIPFTQVTQSDKVRLALSAPSVSELNGAATLTVSRSGSTDEALAVTLTSNDPASLAIVGPSTVTLGAGVDSVTVEVRGVNNFLPDGDRPVTISSAATGFSSASASITVIDDEPDPVSELALFVRDGADPGTVGALATAPGASASSDAVLEGSGGVGTPTTPLVYEIDGVTGVYVGGETEIDFYLDAGSNVGSATQARVSYDFDGDGGFDRVETYGIFATDPIAGWESYARSGSQASVTGAFADMQAGRVRLELWKAFGPGDVDLRTDASGPQGQQSVLVAPFAPQPELAGDFNGDGSVDAADYTVYRDTLGLEVPAYFGADADGNGRVESSDRLAWVANFGATASAQSAALTLATSPGVATAAGEATEEALGLVGDVKSVPLDALSLAFAAYPTSGGSVPAAAPGAAEAVSGEPIELDVRRNLLLVDTRPAPEDREVEATEAEQDVDRLGTAAPDETALGAAVRLP